MSFCCGTLSSPYDAANAFLLMNGNTVLPNRAIAGFGEDVWNAPITEENSRTDLHAIALYEYLATGKTLKEAVNYANEKHPLLADPDGGEEAVMQVHGDEQSTIVGVYTATVIAPRPWYIVNP